MFLSMLSMFYKKPIFTVLENLFVSVSCSCYNAVLRER